MSRDPMTPDQAGDFIERCAEVVTTREEAQWIALIVVLDRIAVTLENTRRDRNS